MRRSVKRLAQAVQLAHGRMTSSARALPDFLIVGAQRCGTTTLYRALAGHPAIRKPVFRKGVHFFDMAYDRDLSWYRAHFPIASATSRYGLRALTFESSPYYLFHPLSAARIAADLPGVRLIVLLRDPAERAYSAWAHERARGFEDLPFEEALAAEPARLAGEEERLAADPGAVSHAHRHQAYAARGRYAAQLDRLSSRIDPDRILVLDSWYDAPLDSYKRVLSFLGLPPAATPAFDRENARPRGPMPSSVRRRLLDEFEKPDAALEPWLGGPPSWRLPAALI